MCRPLAERLWHGILAHITTSLSEQVRLAAFLPTGCRPTQTLRFFVSRRKAGGNDNYIWIHTRNRFSSEKASINKESDCAASAEIKQKLIFLLALRRNRAGRQFLNPIKRHLLGYNEREVGLHGLYDAFLDQMEFTHLLV